MEKVGKIVLGNGLAAKVFAFYNREYSIIGPENDYATDEISNSTFFLHTNSWNKAFLEDLERESGKPIPSSIKKAEVLQLDDQGRLRRVITDKERQRIIDKKLTDHTGTKLQHKDSIFKKEENLSCAQDSSLEFIDVDLAEIVNRLDGIIADQVYSRDLVTELYPDKKILVTSGGAHIEYDKCISTIPADIFYKLTGHEFREKTLDTTIIPGTYSPVSNGPKPSIIYIMNDDDLCKVIKRNKKDYCEFTGVKAHPDAKVIKRARLVKSDNMKFYKDIIFLGRYAQWDPHIRLEDVIRRSSSKTVLQDIFDEQREFSARYFDFEENIDDLQSNIKNITLLMQDEMFSLLNEINWKLHKPQKSKLDFDKIKEEWIDIFKYWLTIGVNLGMSPEDFVDAFYKKSKKLKGEING